MSTSLIFLLAEQVSQGRLFWGLFFLTWVLQVWLPMMVTEQGKESKLAAFTHPPSSMASHPHLLFSVLGQFSFCWSTKLVTTYTGFYGCHNKEPHTRWLKTTETPSLRMRLKSEIKVLAGLAPSKGPRGRVWSMPSSSFSGRLVILGIPCLAEGSLESLPPSLQGVRCVLTWLSCFCNFLIFL